MPETQEAGLSLLLDHARQDVPYIPRHCACPGCRLDWGHWQAVAR